MRFLRRLILFTGLVASALLLSGCVYLRLLQLKWQLAEFDQNFAVQTDDGLTLTFKKPVLLDADVESFFHWVPEARRRSGAAETWRFVWVKRTVGEDGTRPPTEFSIDVMFVEHKLVKLSASESFFAATMPKSLALAALRSLGGAKVDKKNRRAESQIASADLQAAAQDPFLTAEGLITALGAPVARTEQNGLHEWRYEFEPASKRQRFGNSGAVEVTFTLDPATQRVRLMKGRSVFGAVVFDTTNVGPNATGTMHARQ